MQSSSSSPSGNCSQSVLKNIAIVSSSPKVAEQIVANSSGNCNVGKSNVSNGNGPKVANNNSSGPKLATNNAKLSNSTSSGPKAANNSNVTSGSKIGSKPDPNDAGAVISDSKPEHVFRKPKVPSGVRSHSHSPVTSIGVHQYLPVVVDSRPSRSQSRTC